VLCTTCHQGGSPIFSPNPWPETNGSTTTDHQVADMITNAMRGATDFHTYPVRTPRDVPYNIDNAVERAGYVIANKRVWMSRCGGDADGAKHCRELTLRFALEWALTHSFPADTPDYEALKAAWASGWQTGLPGGLKVPDFSLPAYNPLADTAANQP